MGLAAEVPSNASLAEILRARALRTPADRLGIDIVGGALVSGVALWARPGGWVAMMAAALCFASYGAWAVAERRLGAPPAPDPAPHRTIWRVVHGVAAVAGLGAFGLLLFATLGIALGRIIS
jgi:hypothetical protein